MTNPAAPAAGPRRASRLARVLRILFPVLLALGLLAALVWIFGPREPVRLEGVFDPAAIGDDVERYLARTEADVPNLRPDAAKHVRWAYPASRARTPLALVYVHGFSASGRELDPVMDMVATRLGANLFVTRLAGHGRDGAAMAEATIGDWSDDMAEALAIGRRLGERVVVVGNSTGATIAALAALRPGAEDTMAGLVALAPNFGITDWRGFLLTMPFARELTGRFGPPEWGSESPDARVNRTWTTTYPSSALLPMARIADVARGANVEAARVPALFVYAAGDTLVDARQTERLAARWGAPHETVLFEGSQDPRQHILAGDIVSPATTDLMVDIVSTWIEELPAAR